MCFLRKVLNVSCHNSQHHSPPPNKTGLQSEDVAGMKEDMYSYGQLLSEMLNPQHQGI